STTARMSGWDSPVPDLEPAGGHTCGRKLQFIRRRGPAAQYERYAIHEWPRAPLRGRCRPAAGLGASIVASEIVSVRRFRLVSRANSIAANIDRKGHRV